MTLELTPAEELSKILDIIEEQQEKENNPFDFQRDAYNALKNTLFDMDKQGRVYICPLEDEAENSFRPSYDAICLETGEMISLTCSDLLPYYPTNKGTK